MILQGDCLDTLKTLPAKSAHCCVTSPPYWGLRDYGTAIWEGGNCDCDHMAGLLCSDKSGLAGYTSENIKLRTNCMPYKTICGKCGAKRIDQQLGLEQTPDEYVAKMVEVFREVKRVLRDDGTVWLNLGDSYTGSGQGGGGCFESMCESRRRDTVIMPRQNNGVVGLKSKNLVGIPWRVAFALQADGWYLRQDIIWHKPNPMPESVTDRCTKAHEYIFLLSKKAKYYYDAEAIKEPAAYAGQPRGGSTNRYEQNNAGMDNVEYSSRNKRSVWTVNTAPCPDAHFATFPPKLIEPCILAGTSEKGCCPECGSPWERVVEKEVHEQGLGRNHISGGDNMGGQGWEGVPRANISTKTLGWQPTCKCEWELNHEQCQIKPIPCTVLDCFGGAGTTAIVSIKHGRKYILCELNQDYIDIANKRIAKARESIALFGGVA